MKQGIEIGICHTLAFEHQDSVLPSSSGEKNAAIAALCCADKGNAGAAYLSRCAKM